MKISFGSSGGFKFGGGSTNDSVAPSTGGGFTFGSGAAVAAPSNTTNETGKRTINDLFANSSPT